MRPEKPKVITSIHNEQVDRCVDIFLHENGSWGFKEFRRDIEDQGSWFAVSHYEGGNFASHEEAELAARQSVAWLRDLTKH